MGIFLAISSAFFSATLLIFSKVFVTKSKNELIPSFWFQIIAALLFVPLFVFIKPYWQFSLKSLGLLLLSISMWSAYNYFGYKSNKYIDISLSSIILQISVFVPFIGGIVLLGETITKYKVIGLCIIILGNIILFFRSSQKQTKSSKKGIALRIISSLSLGFALLFDSINLDNFSPVLYGSLMFLFPGIIIGLISRANTNEAVAFLKKNNKGLILMASMGTLSYLAVLYSLGLVGNTVTIPINSSYSIIAVIMGIIFLKETTNLTRKILASIVVFVGVVIVSIS